jgi:hypothetical protein
MFIEDNKGVEDFIKASLKVSDFPKDIIDIEILTII